MASSVLFEPVPAITGTRRLTTATVNSMTRLCSSWDNVADSPVVPQGTMPFVPLAICHSMSSANARSSTFPFRNGVTMATSEPVNIRHLSIQKCRNGFALDQVVVGFSLANDVDLSTFDQHLRHAGTGIVV